MPSRPATVLMTAVAKSVAVLGVAQRLEAQRRMQVMLEPRAVGPKKQTSQHACSPPGRRADRS